MVEWVCFYHSMTNGRNSLLKPWETEHFPVLSLFFHLSLPNIWHTHPHKNFVFEINRDRSIISQSLRVLKLKIVDSESIWNWVIFDYIFTRNAKKHFVVDWLSWLPYKSGFINANILEALKLYRPNTAPSLKLLKQRVHELARGSTEPLPP